MSYLARDRLDHIIQIWRALNIQRAVRKNLEGQICALFPEASYGLSRSPERPTECNVSLTIEDSHDQRRDLDIAWTRNSRDIRITVCDFSEDGDAVWEANVRMDEAAAVAGDAVLQPGVCDDPKRVLLVGLPSGDGPYLIVHEFRRDADDEDACLVLEFDGAGNADPGNMIVAEPSGELHLTYWICGDEYTFDGYADGRRVLRQIDTTDPTRGV